MSDLVVFVRCDMCDAPAVRFRSLGGPETRSAHCIVHAGMAHRMKYKPGWEGKRSEVFARAGGTMDDWTARGRALVTVLRKKTP